MKKNKDKMTKDELLQQWRKQYKELSAIPQQREVSDAEVLEQLAIVAFSENNFTNPFFIKSGCREFCDRCGNELHIEYV